MGVFVFVGNLSPLTVIFYLHSNYPASDQLANSLPEEAVFATDHTERYVLYLSNHTQRSTHPFAKGSYSSVFKTTL